MIKLAATLGTTGIAAALLLAAFQVLPPRESGSAQAGTGPQAPVRDASVRAWADPTRADRPGAPSARAPSAGTGTAPAMAAVAVAAASARPTADDSAIAIAVRRPDPQADRPTAARPERARRRVAVQARRARSTQAAAVTGAGPAPVGSAPVRMAGPVGDILRGLGLD